MGVLEISILAWITIIIVGFIKDFDPFAKIQKELRRPIYLFIDALLAFGLSAIYFAIFKLSFSELFITEAIKVMTATLSLYAVYENTKLKELTKIAKEKLLGVICKKTISDKAQKLLTSLTAVVDKIEPTKEEVAVEPTVTVDTPNTQN